MSGPLGKKVTPPAPPTPPEWKPHPTDRRFEVNIKGQLRTKVDLPPIDPIWPFIWAGSAPKP